ncbi:MAG: 1-phosphofructokinase family hexose kinase [Oscillospiraceae bacterium]|nr:1-phosphofructokinase family hexose kinase [Oscillospiraceae bacterium]
MRIATLTLNPALDRTVYCENVGAGKLNRAVSPSVLTHGGKGTNVSCVLKIFGAESTAYGFVGGGEENNNGKLFKKLLAPYKIKHDFTETKCDTRLNIKVIDKYGEPTEFNEPGGLINPDEKQDLLNKIKNIISDGVDLFFMGGSVPPGIEKSIYRDIIDLDKDNRTKFILDCDGEALRLCMENKNKPYMIKPNQFELEQYTGKKFELGNNFVGRGDPDAPSGFDEVLEEIEEEAKKIYNKTGVIVLCTLGEYGALYCGSEGAFYKNAPKVEVRGFTGAGDTFLAAFCMVYFGLPGDFSAPFREGGVRRARVAESALGYAVAASAAKVTKPGTQFAAVEEVEAMRERVNN